MRKVAAGLACLTMMLTASASAEPPPTPVYHLLGPVTDADKRLGPVAPDETYIGLRFETNLAASGISGVCAREDVWKRVANAALRKNDAIGVNVTVRMAGTPVIGPFPSQEFTRTIFAVQNVDGSNCTAAVDQLTDATPWFLADGLSSQVSYSTKVWRASNIKANLSAVLIGLGTMTGNPVTTQTADSAETIIKAAFGQNTNLINVRPVPVVEGAQGVQTRIPPMIRNATEGTFRSWLVTRRSIITQRKRAGDMPDFSTTSATAILGTRIRPRSLPPSDGPQPADAGLMTVEDAMRLAPALTGDKLLGWYTYFGANPSDEQIKTNAAGYFERCSSIAQVVESLPLTTYDKGAVLWALSQRQREWARIARIAGTDCFSTAANHLQRANLAFPTPERPPARPPVPVTKTDMDTILLLLRNTFDSHAVDDTAATIEAVFGATGKVVFLDRNKLVFDSPVRTELTDRSDIATLRRASVTLRCARPLVRTTPGLESLTESRYESLGITNEGKVIWVRLKFEDRPYNANGELAPTRISGVEVYPAEVLRLPENGVALGYFRQTYPQGCSPLPGTSDRWKPDVLITP